MSTRAAAKLFFLVLAAYAAPAQVWTPVGPPGGDVRSLASDPRDPRVVYLGTADGIIYRSDDGGQHWRHLTPGFPLRGMSLDELVVDPQGRLFVGYWEVHGPGGGGARSEDGGRTVALLPDIAGQAVRALAVAPSDPDLLVAGTRAGVFRSRNGGRSWSRISPADDPELRNVSSIAIDPLDPEVIYAGTWHLPWKTTDGGRAWTSTHAGIIEDSDIMTLTFDRHGSRTLYATACTGIYRSTDAALRWSKLRGITSRSRRTRAFAQDPARPHVLLAGTTEGLWTSEDGGASWRLATQRELVVNAVLVLPEGGVLLGTEGAGVLRSADRGRTWSASNEGFSERFVSRLVFDPPGGRILAVVHADRHRGGVLEAPRPSGPWSRLGSGLEGRDVLSLAVAGDEVLAGSDDGIFSMSAARTWTRLPTILDAGLDAHPRVIDLATPGNRIILAATARGLLRSTDGGAHWQRVSLGIGGAVTALAVSSTGRSVAAATPLGVFGSTDAGATWTQASSALAETAIHALAFLPGDERVLLAATPKGLVRSTYQGRTWMCRGGGLPLGDITGLAFHPDGRTVFASDFTWGGIYRSEDGGDTWQPFPTDGLLSPRVWAVAVDPSAPATLLAAAVTGGLHQWALPALAPAATGSPERARDADHRR